MVPYSPIRVTGELRDLRARLLALEKYVGAPTPQAQREAELKRREEDRLEAEKVWQVGEGAQSAAPSPEPPSGPMVDGDLPTAAEGAVEAAEPALEPALGPPVEEAEAEPPVVAAPPP